MLFLPARMTGEYLRATSLSRDAPRRKATELTSRLTLIGEIVEEKTRFTSSSPNNWSYAFWSVARRTVTFRLAKSAAVERTMASQPRFSQPP